MEQTLARIVNAAIEGESENAVLQILETNQSFNFSQIKLINEGENVREASIADADLSNSDIQTILNNGHTVNITFDENDNVTLFF